jgi:hypothetical protein
LSGCHQESYRICKRYKDTKTNQDVQKYYILLIITDGVINDMNKTIYTIVKSSRYNLSVVIVGVYDADFSDMVKLDADDGSLVDSNGNIALQDNVQFEEFNEHKDDPDALARETLLGG